MIKLPREYNKPHFGVIASGISGNIGGWDIEDDFDTDEWVDKNAAISVNTGSSRLDWNCSNRNTDYKSYRDFGSNASDTAWVLQYVHDITTISGSQNVSCHCGMSSGTDGQASAQDFLGVTHELGDGQHYTCEADGAALPLTGDDSHAGVSVEDNGIRITRDSATALSVDIYPDGTFGTADELLSTTVASTIQSLRYISVQNRSDDGASATTYSGNIDTLKFADAVTEPPA